MADTIDRTLARQVLAGIIAAPAHLAASALAELDTGDFEHWIDAAVFDALGAVTFAEHQEPGSVITQVNRHLLDAGKYKGTDDGLRQFVVELAQTEGHPEMLPAFTRDLIEQRLRRDATDYALSVAGHAATSPLPDLITAMNEIAGLKVQSRRATAPEATNIHHINERKARA